MKPRAASYTRVSSDGQEQDGSSLHTQAEAIARYCRDHGYELTPEHCYQDVWTGAEYRERPGLTAMREAIRKKEIDVFVCYALDRLSRNSGHMFVIFDEAQYHGVRFECVTESWDDSHEGKLMRDVKGFVAAVEREKIAERSVRGRKARITEKGLLIPGSKPPYGYRWPDERDSKGKLIKGRLEIDPETAPVVQRIYGALAGGATLRSIAIGLTRDSIPTPTGARGQWQAGTIAHMVHRHQYKGEAWAWGWVKQTKDRPQGFDPDKAIRLPDGTIPPLVDEATWDAVQIILERNKARAVRSAKDPESALLRGGYVRCGYCGGPMYPRPRTSGKYEYVCRRGQNYLGECVKPTISVRKVDSAVWAKVEEILTNPITIREQLERQQAEGYAPLTERLTSLDRSLAKIDQQQVNLTNAVAMVSSPDAIAPLLARLEDVANHRRAVLDERDHCLAMQAEWENHQADLSSVEAWCGVVAENLRELTFSQKRLALDVLGVGVQVWKADHNPRFVVTCEIDAPAGELVSHAS